MRTDRRDGDRPIVMRDKDVELCVLAAAFRVVSRQDVRPEPADVGIALVHKVRRLRPFSRKHRVGGDEPSDHLPDEMRRADRQHRVEPRTDIARVEVFQTEEQRCRQFAADHPPLPGRDARQTSRARDRHLHRARRRASMSCPSSPGRASPAPRCGSRDRASRALPDGYCEMNAVIRASRRFEPVKPDGSWHRGRSRGNK